MKAIIENFNGILKLSQDLLKSFQFCSNLQKLIRLWLNNFDNVIVELIDVEFKSSACLFEASIFNGFLIKVA